MIALDKLGAINYHKSMKKTYKLLTVGRPQQEFPGQKIGETFEIDPSRLVASPDGKFMIPNPAATPGYMGPKYIAIFEEVA